LNLYAIANDHLVINKNILTNVAIFSNPAGRHQVCKMPYFSSRPYTRTLVYDG
jgi:hypothetical protein